MADVTDVSHRMDSLSSFTRIGCVSSARVVCYQGDVRASSAQDYSGDVDCTLCGWDCLLQAYVLFQMGKVCLKKWVINCISIRKFLFEYHRIIRMCSSIRILEKRSCEIIHYSHFENGSHSNVICCSVLWARAQLYPPRPHTSPKCNFWLPYLGSEPGLCNFMIALGPPDWTHQWEESRHSDMRGRFLFIWFQTLTPPRISGSGSAWLNRTWLISKLVVG